MKPVRVLGVRRQIIRRIRGFWRVFEDPGRSQAPYGLGRRHKPGVPDFAALPVVTVTSDCTNDGAFVGMTNGLQVGSVGIRITTGGGTLSDRTFNFTAIGPR